MLQETEENVALVRTIILHDIRFVCNKGNIRETFMNRSQVQAFTFWMWKS